MVGKKGRSGRKKKKNPPKRYRILTQKNEIIKAIKDRHLEPVKIKGTTFITIADLEDFYDNSDPIKSKYERISWDEFIGNLKDKNLYILQETNTGFLKIVREDKIKKLQRYIEGI